MANKILFFDIEWEPATAYVWRMWDENISPDQLIDEGGLLCFCWKFSDESTYGFMSKWGDGRPAMAQKLKELFSEADAVVTYNGDRYDIPKAHGEMILAGLSPPPPVTSIDLLKAVKKLGFVMNRLAYIGPLLGVGKKTKHAGFSLWKGVMDGDAKAQRTMERYCIQDVRLTVRLYNRILPYIRNHPHLGSTRSNQCGACNSNHVHSRGYRRTKSYRIQRIQCQKCGSWQDGKREKLV